MIDTEQNFLLEIHGMKSLISPRKHSRADLAEYMRLVSEAHVNLGTLRERFAAEVDAGHAKGYENYQQLGRAIHVAEDAVHQLASFMVELGLADAAWLKSAFKRKRITRATFMEIDELYSEDHPPEE
jgi:hypothetical protein